jgi:hypothetical protein
MRITAPEPFTVHLSGPEGPYRLAFRPSADRCAGNFDVEIAGTSIVWPVEVIERQEGGELVLSGFADTSFWDDVFWFELIAEPSPPRITYWGDKVIWRTDYGEGRS